MKVIVTFSGGKDSLAALLWVREHITTNFTTVFCDTGWEHPLTYDYIHRIADRLHLDLVTLKSPKYDGMVDLARRKKRWPSTRARFCTQELKTKPCIDYVLDNVQDNMLMIQGIRAAESPNRAAMLCPTTPTFATDRRIMEIIVDAFLDALIDGVKMLPFLYLAYLLIEWLERNHGERIEKALAGGGHWGFVPGALLGCVPQCGFSAVAANFYASRVITPGTLLAVFLATSDEAIPLLAAEPTLWNKLGLLLVLKIVFGIAAGLVLDVPLRRILPKGLYGGYEGHADEVDCHEEHEEHSSIFLAALRHTLEIFVFILVFSFIIGLIFGLVGADSAAAFLGSLGIFQPMMAALIGLVPNCGASVLLAQLYMGGAITFGSFFAGLCSGAGIGLAVLWRVNPSWKQNLFMTGLLWFCGTCCGILLQWVV